MDRGQEALFGAGKEGGENKQHHCAYNEHGGEFVFHLGFHLAGDGLAILAEKKEQYCKGGKGAKLHGPEYARAAVHPEKSRKFMLAKPPSNMLVVSPTSGWRRPEG